MSECEQWRLGLSQTLRDCRREFEAMGSANRQNIFISLLEADPLGLRVGKLMERTHLSRPALSHHRKVLREAGPAEPRRKGTRNYYFPSTEPSGWAKLKFLFDQAYRMVQDANAAGWNAYTKQKEEP